MIIQYNKFKWIKIKISKGESSILNILENKHDILKRYIEFLKNKKLFKNDEIEIYETFNPKLSLKKNNNKLNEMNKLINTIMDNNEKLFKNETIIGLNKELNQLNIKLRGCKKYYNDNVILYNKLCKSFPSLLIAKLFHEKEKDYLDEETPNILKILDD